VAGTSANDAATQASANNAIKQVNLMVGSQGARGASLILSTGRHGAIIVSQS
jgi:hypothetical protein